MRENGQKGTFSPDQACYQDTIEHSIVVDCVIELRPETIAPTSIISLMEALKMKIAHMHWFARHVVVARNKNM
jgi:hypothetical protein